MYLFWCLSCYFLCTWSIQHPHAPLLQTLADIANLNDCWLCSHMASTEGDILNVVAIPVTLGWWITYPQTTEQPQYFSNYTTYWSWGKHRETIHFQGRSISYNRYGYTKRETLNRNALGIPDIKLSSHGLHPICIENRNGTGKFLGVSPYHSCTHIVSFNSMDGTWFSQHRENELECFHIPLDLGIPTSLREFLFLNFTDSEWITVSKALNLYNSSIYLTKGLGLCQQANQIDHVCEGSSFNTHTPWLDIWVTIACAYPEKVSKTWKHLFSNTGKDIVDLCSHYVNLPRSGNNLIVALPAGLYWVCGNRAYRALPPGWTGRCAPAHLAPTIYVKPSLNASQVLNLGSLLHRTRRQAKINYVPNPLATRNTKFHQWTRTILPRLGVNQLEKAIINISRQIELSFNQTLLALTDMGTEINSLGEVVRQNRRALDILTAQEGGACAVLGEVCCFYVNETGSIAAHVQNLKDQLQIWHNMGKENPMDIWAWLTSWLPNWGLWAQKIIIIIVCICLLLIITCCCLQCIPTLIQLFMKAFRPRHSLGPKYTSVPLQALMRAS
ncbi:endogenous retroviral envelope protein HEMO-like [Hemicordylus capensis]|uniref:endogenous retroviral envelope protein HEMO-like n=1 Tax=Hemicordylus capensis TaxID=884348 RepID=UPI002304A2A3|nr:endogenous retroviral envelope protein HEMO-like [Hemicordylus capensis]